MRLFSRFRQSRKQHQTRIIAIVFLMIAAAIWGIATPVVKYTVTDIPPFTFLALRFGLASIICLPAAVYFLLKTKFNLARVKKILLAALIGHIITLSLFFIGVSKTSAIEASFITAFSPLVLAFLAFAILRERIRKNELEGILIAFIGVMIIIVEPFITNQTNGQFARISFIGNVILLFAVVADALYNLYVKSQIVKDKIITPINLIVFAYIVAFFAYVPLALLEQLNLYNIETKNKFHTLIICTADNYDIDLYRKDIKCDSVGCYKNVVADNNNLAYFCRSPEQSQNTMSFKEFLTTNFKDYFKTWNMLGVAYMALLSGLLAYMLFAYSLKHIEVSDAAPFLYTQPIFGVSIAMLFLNEKPSFVIAIAALLVVIGIVYSTMRKR